MEKTYQLTWDFWPKKNPLIDYPSTTYFCLHTEWFGNRFKVINGDAAYSQGATTVNQPAISLEYSYDGETWMPLVLDTYVEFSNKVFLRGNNELWLRGGDIQQTGQITAGTLICPRFIVDKNFYVSGKLSSLVQKDITANVTTRLFPCLFYNQPLLDAQYLQLNFSSLKANWNNTGTDGPHGLPINLTSLVPSTNYVGPFTAMFFGCEKLEHAPSLPDFQSSQTISISEFCFAYMFSYCWKLKECMKIDHLLIASGGYAICSFMYGDCKALTAAKALPNFSAPNTQRNIPALYAFYAMFGDCINLKTMPDMTKYKVSDNSWNIGSFEYMFARSGVEVSDTQNEYYKWVVIDVPNNEYMSPLATYGIFYDTQGSYKANSALTINAKYYTNIEPIQ